MSDLDNAINSINASAAKAENTATFLDDMSTFDDQSSVTNPNNGQTVASIPKQVKDRTDVLFAAAESEINQAVATTTQNASEAAQSASEAATTVETQIRERVGVYKIGNISDYAGQQLTEAEKENQYQYPDDSDEWYGPAQDQVFPIAIPSDPSSDNGWALVNAITSDSISLYTDIVYKSSGGNSAIENMVQEFNLNPSIHPVGSVLKTGSMSWIYKSALPPVTIDNFESFNPPNAFDFGFLGNDSADNTSQIQNVTSYSSDGETIDVGRGSFVGEWSNLKNQVRGNGASTILKSPTVGLPVITLDRHTPDWDYYYISNMTIDGTVSGPRDSNAVEMSSVDRFAGRWNFDNVYFSNSDICVNKPQGNIGDQYTGCTYRQSDFGHKAVSSNIGTMHAGATSWLGSHWDNIDVACIAINDNTAGMGGYSVNQCIMESCDGFGYFAIYNNVTPFIPPVIDQLWLENVALSATTEIDSITYTTRDMYFEGAVYQEIRNSYLKSMQLVNSVIVARGCRIDDAASQIDFDFDDDSFLFVDDLFSNGSAGGLPFVRSIANQVNTSITKQLSVRGPLMLNQIDINDYQIATDIASNSYSGIGPWNFTGTGTIQATSVSDGVLNDSCANLVVPDGFTLQGAQVGAPSVGKWVVWSIHCKLISGDLAVSKIGSEINLGDVYLTQGKWVRSYGIQKIDTTGLVRLRFENSSGASAELRIADQTVVEFDLFSDAIEYCNSLTSLKSEV